MSLFKKIRDSINNVVSKAQVSTAVMGLEAQKKAKENTVMQTMQQLRLQKEGLYSRIGQKCYETHLAGEFNDDRFSELFDLVKQITASTQEQEALLEDIRRRFEEELSLLKGRVAVTKTAACPKCTAAYISGVDFFCAECGEDLRRVSSQCPNCGQAYDPEKAHFCTKCGQSLKS